VGGHQPRSRAHGARATASLSQDPTSVRQRGVARSWAGAMGRRSRAAAVEGSSGRSKAGHVLLGPSRSTVPSGLCRLRSVVLEPAPATHASPAGATVRACGNSRPFVNFSSSSLFFRMRSSRASSYSFIFSSRRAGQRPDQQERPNRTPTPKSAARWRLARAQSPTTLRGPGNTRATTCACQRAGNSQPAPSRGAKIMGLPSHT